MGYKDEYEVKKQIKDQDGTRVYLVHHKTLGGSFLLILTHSYSVFSASGVSSSFSLF